MKILYAIQGTGNGHMARAREIIPLLKARHKVDILVSGTQSDIDLPHPVKYKCYGLSFIFGKKGGVDLVQTYRKAKLKKLVRDIRALPVGEYDLVISDFEPVSAWACHAAGKPCIALSHQSAVLHKKAPQPRKADAVGKAILKTYAPSTHQFSFHFKAYAKDIFTPVIRSEIRGRRPSNLGHYTVYLPAYSDKKILQVLRQFDVRWEVFSKHYTKAHREKNIIIMPVSNQAFIESMLSATGVLCGAGFETPAEALFLQKKLMVIPMKGQYEQQCNAAALKEMGVPVIRDLKEKNLPAIRKWILGNKKIEVDYPDNTASILEQVLALGAASAKTPAAKTTTPPKNLAKTIVKKLLKSIRS